MVVKSEYRRAFRPKLECQVYEGNVDYRLQRRQVEAGHSHDAFVWDDSESDSENSCTGKDTKPIHRPASVPPHLYKHKLFNEAYQRKKDSQQAIPIVIQQGKFKVQPGQNKQNHQQQNGSAPDDDVQYINVPKASPRPAVISEREEEEEGEEVDGHRDRQVQTPDWSKGKRKHRRRRRRKSAEREQKDKAKILLVRDDETQTNGDLQVQAPVDDKPRRPKKPGQKVYASKKVVAKPRPFSAPLGRPAKKTPPQTPDEEKPPFMPYGFKDKERETGVKKTYNVRSPVDVYPSALRALRRKQSDIAAREKAAKNAPLRERRQKAVFNSFDEQMRRETCQWDTEYRRHFVGYEKREYEHPICSRTPGPSPDSRRHDLRASC